MSRKHEIAAIADKLNGDPASLPSLSPSEGLLLLDEIRALRGAVRLFVDHSMSESRPSRGESFIGWQRGDGPTALERVKIARALLEQ